MLKTLVVGPKIKNTFVLVSVVVLVLLTTFPLFAQKKTKIKLIHANELIGRTIDKTEYNIFVGDVAFMHDSATLYCDSAILNPDQNSLTAYEKVHIYISDTLCKV